MSIPMEVRELAIACLNAARRIDTANAAIDANRKRMADMGYPDLCAVLAAIDAEEQEKPPAIIPNQK
jgi:hypothetical protein